MTLNTPRLNTISVFDANYPYTFSFMYAGEQVIRNRVIIRENKTNHTLYDNCQDGLRLNHTIPPNTLVNNNIYSIQVQVFDATNQSSNLSETCIFSCHTTPQFYFSNINNNETISSANLSCNLIFTQDEGDAVKEYKYYFFDSNKSQISVSDSYYSLNDKHTYYGLKNITSYYLRALGTTVYGFIIDTGYIQVNIKYDRIPTNVAFEAINIDGKINLTSNIILTDYDLKNDNYKLENGELQLKENTITYQVLDDVDDFTFVLKGRYLPLNTAFAVIYCKSGQIELSIHNIAGQYYCKMIARNKSDSYVLYKIIAGQILGTSENQAITTTDDKILQTITAAYDPSILIVFEIHRQNGLYSLDAFYQ